MDVCNICASTDLELKLEIKKPDRFELSVGISSDGYLRKWSECKNCYSFVNLHLSKNLVRLSDIESSYYAVDFKGNSIADKFNLVMNLPECQSDNTQRVKRIMQFCNVWFRDKINSDSYAKIIDIGSGTGVFLSKFMQLAADAKHQWSATAVEPDPHAAQHLRSLNCFNVINEAYSDKLKLGLYDLCTLNKVLEHISDPVGFLAGLKKIISNSNGILYVEVPSSLTVFERPVEDNILGALHYNLYSENSLAYCAQKAGFTVLDSKLIYEPSNKITVYAFLRP